MTNKTVKMLRLFSEQSQREFAKELGVAESTIGKIENNLQDVSDNIKSKLLRRYDVADQEFIQFCDRMEAPISQ